MLRQLFSAKNADAIDLDQLTFVKGPSVSEPSYKMNYLGMNVLVGHINSQSSLQKNDDGQWHFICTWKSTRTPDTKEQIISTHKNLEDAVQAMADSVKPLTGIFNFLGNKLDGIKITYSKAPNSLHNVQEALRARAAQPTFAHAAPAGVTESVSPS